MLGDSFPSAVEKNTRNPFSSRYHYLPGYSRFLSVSRSNRGFSWGNPTSIAIGQSGLLRVVITVCTDRLECNHSWHWGRWGLLEGGTSGRQQTEERARFLSPESHILCLASLFTQCGQSCGEASYLELRE